jgi:hypothetical protein
MAPIPGVPEIVSEPEPPKAEAAPPQASTR